MAIGYLLDLSGRIDVSYVLYNTCIIVIDLSGMEP